ncbi:MAG: tail fiber domain-containing protein [Patescibacteria group bacterium]
MNKLKTLLVSVIVGSVVAAVAIAFTGPGASTPGVSNPDFWIKNGNDVYYNPAVSGNVGIGAVGPAYKLDVQGGQINTSGGLCIAGDCKTAWSPNYWTLSGADLYPNQTSYNLGVGIISSDVNYKITTSGGGIKAESVSQPAGYFSSASGYGLIVNSGNVGIGTTAPAGAKLEVVKNGQVASFKGSINNDVWVDITNENTTAGYANLRLQKGNSIGLGLSISNSANEASIGTWTAGWPLKFVTGSSIGERMRITSTGDVGIGTPTPTNKLDIEGGMAVGATYSGTYAAPTNGMIIEGNVGIGTLIPAAKMHVSGGDILLDDNYLIKWGGGSAGIKGENPNNKLYLITANSERITIDNIGNVGIGTMVPAYQLQLSTDSAAKPGTNTWTVASDARIKTDIRPFTDGLNTILGINPVWYKYNGLGGFTADGKDNIGVIAQDMEKVAPYTVSSYYDKLNSDDAKTTELLNFNSGDLTFTTINAIKELNNKIEALRAENEALKIRVEILETR